MKAFKKAQPAYTWLTRAELAARTAWIKIWLKRGQTDKAKKGAEKFGIDIKG